MIPRHANIRIGRPTDKLDEITKMYTEGLGFEVIGAFDDHEGFSGRMVGHSKHHYHLEFTTHPKEKAGRAPSPEHLLIFYLPDEKDYQNALHRLKRSQFKQVTAFNPYWDTHGTTFEDLDGYRLVIAQAPSPF